MSLIDRTGICRACGQSMMVKVPDDFTEAQIEERVTLDCRCAQGWQYRAEKEREENLKTAIERAEALIDTLFPEDENEEDSATDTTYIVEILKKSLRPLSQGDFKKIVINISKTLKVEIKFSNDSFTIKKEDKNIKGGAISY